MPISSVWAVSVCDLEIVSAATAAWMVSKCHLFVPMRRIYVFPDANSHFCGTYKAEKKHFFFSVVVFVIRLLYVSINNRLQWKKDSTWLQNVQMNKVQSIIWIYILMYLLRSYVGFCRKICTIYFLSWSTTMYARARARVSREWKWDCRMFNNKDKTYIHTVSSKLQ